MDETVKTRRYYRPAIKKMRVILLACAILCSFGLHSFLKEFNGLMFGFACPALFILCGYLVLRESANREKRILRAIGRTALCFGILFAAYLALSLLFAWKETTAALATKEFWLDFLLLNTWTLPVGSTIWFVQSLLYAYLILFVLCKLRLLRFDMIIAAVCLAVGFVTGEISSLIGLSLFGHDHLAGNFLTQALPYLLIGCFLHRKKQYFSDLTLRQNLFLAVGGIILSVAEYLALSFSGHLVNSGCFLGEGVVAVALCVFCFYGPEMEFQTEFFAVRSRLELMIPYFVCPLFYYILQPHSDDFTDKFTQFLQGFAGILTLCLSFLTLYLYVVIRHAIENRGNDDDDDEDEDDI